MGACNFSAQHGAHSAMDIAHWQADLDRSKSIDSDARGFEDFVIERVFETVVLRLHASPGHARGHRRAIENCRKIEASRLPVIDCGLNVQHVNPPHHLVETAESQLRHVLTHLLGKKEKEIDHVLGLPLELLAQHGILRSNAYGAGIEMTLAHHHAPHLVETAESQLRHVLTHLLGKKEKEIDHVLGLPLE